MKTSRLKDSTTKKLTFNIELITDLTCISNGFLNTSKFVLNWYNIFMSLM